MADLGFTPEDIELQTLKFDLAIDELHLKLKRITLSELEIKKRQANLAMERKVTHERIAEYTKQKNDLNKEVKE